MEQKKYEQRAQANYKAKLPIYLFQCCIDKKEPKYEDFLVFVLNKEIIKEYACNYLQAYRTELVQDIPVNQIYEFIKKHKSSKDFQYSKERYLGHFEKVLTYDSFEKLTSEKKCTYCGISLEQIEKLGIEKKLCNKRADTRGYTLEIDRISPNEEYINENICMACYWCNNAKTDEFSVKEFKEIAKGINNVWNDRLKDLNQKVVFPENSSIWDK